MSLQVLGPVSTLAKVQGPSLLYVNSGDRHFYEDSNISEISFTDQASFVKKQWWITILGNTLQQVTNHI